MSTLSGGQGNIITNGLVLRLDAANPRSYQSGSLIWNDLSGNGNNGTLTNGPSFTTSGSGAIVFDGVDDYIIENSSINTGQNFSIFAWIKPGNINVRNAIMGNSYPYSAATGWYFATATGYGGTLNTFFVSCGSDNAYMTAANSSITLNTWNFVVGVVTNGGQDIKLYVNGNETLYFGGILAANTLIYNNNEFNVGRRYSNSTEPFIGTIAQTLIYNRALTQSEIQQNFNATRARFGI